MNKFWIGYTTSVCFTQFTMDLMGKDKYLEIVRIGWMDTKCWQWIALWIFAVFLSLANDYMEKKSATSK